MRHTFLVEVDDDDTDFFAAAEDIHADLLTAGHNVTSVKPWANQLTQSQQPSGLPPQAPPGVPGQ